MRITPREIGLTALFAVLTAVGGFLKLPLPVVPVTLQTLVVMLAAIVLGPKLGALSQVVYILAGLMGLPVFAQGGGPGYVFSPTFGFLLGFVPGAFFMGLVYGRLKGRGAVKVWLALMPGLLVIYLMGVPYMYLVLNYVIKKPVVFTAALWIITPFFLVDVFKAVIASVVGPGLKETLVREAIM